MQMTDSPDRATKTLAPLFANSDCSSQLSLLIELEDRLTPAIAEVVADAALPCYGKAPGDVDRCADSPADCRAEVIRMLTKAEHTHK
jgi:hypothetical protein